MFERFLFEVSDSDNNLKNKSSSCFSQLKKSICRCVKLEEKTIKFQQQLKKK